MSDELRDRALTDAEFEMYYPHCAAGSFQKVCFERIKNDRSEIARLRERVAELETGLLEQHRAYCTPDYTERGLHAPECLMYLVEHRRHPGAGQHGD